MTLIIPASTDGDLGRKRRHCNGDIFERNSNTASTVSNRTLNIINGPVLKRLGR
jgi:hypothetical protein